jgi:membrane-associated PAP2 superfamily phosphatase
MTVLRRQGWRDATITLLALALLLAWDATGLDLAAVRAYGSVHGFAWRDAWFTRTVLHDGGRWFAWGVLALLLIDAARPLLAGPPQRARWYWLAVTLACVLLVPAFKRTSLSSCPWDLSEFGGLAAYVSHWRWGVADGGPGHCFPSGHAVAAFGFFGVYFGWRGNRPRLAHLWLGVVLVAGLAFGWAQLARGAHYPSHTLWSAWLCWTLCVLAAYLPRARAVQMAPAAAADSRISA